jgi:hypothetical protein
MTIKSSLIGLFDSSFGFQEQRYFVSSLHLPYHVISDFSTSYGRTLLSVVRIEPVGIDLQQMQQNCLIPFVSWESKSCLIGVIKSDFELITGQAAVVVSGLAF